MARTTTHAHWQDGGVALLGRKHQIPEEADEAAQAVYHNRPSCLVEGLQLLQELGIEGLVFPFGQVRLCSRGPLQVAVVIQQFVIALLDELLRPGEQGQQG